MRRCYPATLVDRVQVKHNRRDCRVVELDPPEPYGRVFKRLREQWPKASITPLRLSVSGEEV